MSTETEDFDEEMAEELGFHPTKTKRKEKNESWVTTIETIIQDNRSTSAIPQIKELIRILNEELRALEREVQLVKKQGRKKSGKTVSFADWKLGSDVQSSVKLQRIEPTPTASSRKLVKIKANNPTSQTTKKSHHSKGISRFNKHLDTKDEKPYKCLVCPKSYCYLGWFLKHKQLHTVEKSYECKLGAESIQVYQNVKISPQKSHKCDKCAKSFVRFYDFQKHLRTHSQGKQEHECPICKKSLSSSSSLRTHMRTHSEARPFKCPICPKSFKHKGQSKTYLQTHTMEKPHKCPFCTKSFARNSQLEMHLRAHTGEKPYECSICKTSFLRSDTLKDHVKTHTGEKPYKCPFCPKSFAQYSTSKTHIATHTGETPYKCSDCVKEFKHSRSLRAHAKTHT